MNPHVIFNRHYSVHYAFLQVSIVSHARWAPTDRVHFSTINGSQLHERNLQTIGACHSRLKENGSRVS